MNIKEFILDKFHLYLEKKTNSDLVFDRHSNYKFDINKFTNTEGKTAIYIQYTKVRIESVLRNINQDQYAENRFISYIPFGKDFDLESYSKPIFDESITGLGAKISESQKLLPKGLRVLEFDIEDEFRKIFRWRFSNS